MQVHLHLLPNLQGYKTIRLNKSDYLNYTPLLRRTWLGNVHTQTLLVWKMHSGYLCEMFVWEPLGESCCHRIGWKEGEGEREEGRKGREGEQRSGQTLVTEGEAFGSVKTGSERAERVRNQRIWPFKSPIQRIRRWVWRYSGIFLPVYYNCNASVRLCNPGFTPPRAAAAESVFISVTNPDFPSPLPAERVGRTGDRVSGRFPTARLDSEDAQATVSKQKTKNKKKTSGYNMLK